MVGSFRFERWFVSNVTPEAVALRHVHAGQAARNNFSLAQSADQASPFASLLDGNDPSPSPASPALTPPSFPGQKPAVRPGDDHLIRSSSLVTTASPQISPSDRPAPGIQASNASSPDGLQGSDGGETAPASGALSKNSAKDAKDTDPVDPSVLATIAMVATVVTGTTSAPAAAGSSTAAASIDIQGDKTAQSDAAPSGTATPPAAPSADTPGAVASQPVAVPISVPVSLPVIPASPTGSGGDSAAGQDATQLAAAADAVKAGAPGTDRANTKPAEGNGTTAGTRADGSKPGAKAPDAATIPSLTPQPAQKDLISPSGAGERNAADALPGNTAGSPAAAASRARQRATDSQPSDGAAPPQDNSNPDSNIDPNGDAKSDLAGSTSRIEDITRQALDTPTRHIEAAAAETLGGGVAHPGGVQAEGTPQSPDGSSGLIAPAALATSAAPTAPATTTAPSTTIPIAGLAVEIASHAQAGKNRFEIRLDPPELGRIDVRLDVDREGRVTSRLIVDRPETLDLLRRDAPALERSLQLAGLKTADDALQFSLRDQSQGGYGSQNPYSNNGAPASAARVIIPDRELSPVDAPAVGYNRVRPSSTGIDIRV
jgi:flagellar hook-length control protein FliK